MGDQLPELSLIGRLAVEWAMSTGGNSQRFLGYMSSQTQLITVGKAFVN